MTGWITRCMFGLQFGLDSVVNFLAIDRHFVGRRKAEPHLIASNPANRYYDVIANDQSFARASRQDQHDPLLAGCFRILGKGSTMP
jgi:hypothetical protein